MKYSAALLALVGLAAAVPAGDKQLAARQLDSNDVKNGQCKAITFIYARGTFEPGNMGVFAGPPFAESLKKLYPNQVAVQGVDYPAGVEGNFMANGADPKGVTDMQNKIKQALEKCPDTKLVLGGYSQGGAVTHLAIAGLDSASAGKIAAVVLFGDTQKQQSKGQIKGISSDIIDFECVDGDNACLGNLLIGIPHLAYAPLADHAANFVKSKIGSLSG